MKTAKQHNAPTVGEVALIKSKTPSQIKPEINNDDAVLGDMEEWRASMKEWKSGEASTFQLLSNILAELKAIREQLKTEVVTRDKFR